MNAPIRTDDELGSALGASLKRRTDGDTLTTPEFGPVRRRAAQITRRRRVVTGAVAAAVFVAAGIGVAQVLDDDEAGLDVVDRPEETVPPTTVPATTLPPDQTEPTPGPSEAPTPVDLDTATLPQGLPELPPLVLARPWSESFELVHQDGDSLVVDAEIPHGGAPSVIRTTTAGEVVAYEVGPDDGTSDFRREVVRYGLDGTRTVMATDASLYDVGVIDGRESVFVSVPSPGEGSFGGVLAVPLDGSQPIDLGLAAEAEFGVTKFDWVDQIGVATAWSDLTEWVGYVGVSGPVDLPSPTDDLEYNAPPNVTAAAFAPDEAVVYWAEGPDWNHLTETIEPQAWRVKGMRLADPATVELDVAISEVVSSADIGWVQSIHVLENSLLVNRIDLTQDGFLYRSPVVIELGGDTRVHELPFEGIAAPATGTGS